MVDHSLSCYLAGSSVLTLCCASAINVPSCPLVSSLSKSRLCLHLASTLALSPHLYSINKWTVLQFIKDLSYWFSVWHWIMMCDRCHWSRMWLVSNNRHLNITKCASTSSPFSFYHSQLPQGWNPVQACNANQLILCWNAHQCHLHS